MAYSATIRELEIIGEAISKISKQTKEKNPQIDYRTIKDFRNVTVKDKDITLTLIGFKEQYNLDNTEFQHVKIKDSKKDKE